MATIPRLTRETLFEGPCRYSPATSVLYSGNIGGQSARKFFLFSISTAATWTKFSIVSAPALDANFNPFIHGRCFPIREPAPTSRLASTITLFQQHAHCALSNTPRKNEINNGVSHSACPRRASMELNTEHILQSATRNA